MQEGIKKTTNRAVILGEQVILLAILVATLVAVAQEIGGMINAGKVALADLFMLFIFAEVLGMVGAFYNSQRIPVTLPIIIAMTALTRMIILQSKDIAAVNILYESAGILILALSSLVMSAKEKISLEKLRMRESAAGDLRDP
jgi:protein PsiE